MKYITERFRMRDPLGGKFTKLLYHSDVKTTMIYTYACLYLIMDSKKKRLGKSMKQAKIFL